MVKVSCSVRYCIYNNYELCSANTIRISGQKARGSKSTNCKTFTPNDFQGTVEGLLHTNYIGQIEQMFNDNESIVMSPAVECEAELCKYNKNGLCESKDIFVNIKNNSSEVKTECETFKQK